MYHPTCRIEPTTGFGTPVGTRNSSMDPQWMLYRGTTWIDCSVNEYIVCLFVVVVFLVFFFSVFFCCCLFCFFWFCSFVLPNQIRFVVLQSTSNYLLLT